MIYYLAFIERNDTDFYQLVIAKTKTEAYSKVKKRYPDAYGIEIDDAIE